MESIANHRRRAAGAPDGNLRVPKSSSKAPVKVFIIPDPQIEFLRILKTEKQPQPKNQPQGGGDSSFSLSKPGDNELRPNGCRVCLQDVPVLTGEKINAVTSCEHVLCFECALLLFFITKKTDCPICRQKLTKMILTRNDKLDSTEAVKDYTSSMEESKSLRSLPRLCSLTKPGIC